MEQNLEQEERERNYQKIFSELNIDEQSVIKMPIFTPGKVAIFEGISFGITIEPSPLADSINNYCKENKYVVLGIPYPKDKNADNNFIRYYEYACICEIKRLRTIKNNAIKLDFLGVMPVYIESTEILGDMDYANVKPMLYKPYEPTENDLDKFEEYKSLFAQLMSYRERPNDDFVDSILKTVDINAFINLTIPIFVNKFENYAFFMRETDAIKRLDEALSIIKYEISSIKVTNSISQKVHEKLEKNQKEMILREQLKVINDELDGEVDEIENSKEKVRAKGMPEETEKYVINEINRLKKLPFGSPELGYIRNFLDTILELPFKEKTEDDVDLAQAKEILDQNHYGLEDVKERIIEYLAVLKRTQKLSGQILCFIGPPGIGKTSIVKSIAKALNRNFVQMSLGGISDESLIRGHSRTYVGARAGRIIMGMKTAKSVNPVFLLDEVDKLTKDMRGDPSSALLEVLDPEQNSHFKDNFLEVEYDLSQVLFVATANDKSLIPSALLDRMEVVELTTYTENEKVEIAKRHLIPRQLEKCGLTNEEVTITDEALRDIITDYCAEAGVRDFERKISQILRKVVVNMQNQKPPFIINASDLQEYLGAKVIPMLHIYQGGNVGEAIGLAWTQVGGTALSIEVALSEGTGKIKYTGKLGDVFKESVELAMSIVKSKAKEFGIDPSVFKTTDVHIHLPEMAIGKDGPSAGITITTALVSAFTKRATKPKFVMTGEISLLGRVLPIGGLKEKMLAGIKIGATDVIIPKSNESDYIKHKALVDGKLKVHLVSNINEVLDLILQK